PAFVSTLCICIVFVPMFFLTGVARYLFVPLAEAVVFAMLASYVLSRTLVPTLVMWFYRNVHYYGARPSSDAPGARPSSGAANVEGRGIADNSGTPEPSYAAAPGDGRTPTPFWLRPMLAIQD